MRNDQIVRMVVSVCMVALYYIHVSVNGGGPVSVLGIGSLQPFGFIALLELSLAFPETLDRLPFGNTKKNQPKKKNG